MDSGFSMAVIDAEEIANAVKEETKVETEESKKLREQAEANALAVFNSDLASISARKAFITSIEQFGIDTMSKSAAKNSLMKTKVVQLAQNGGESGEVAKGLVDLQREIKGLDPGSLDFTKKGVFGKVFSPLRSYFDKYQKAEDVIADIIDSLDKGKETLKNDNITLLIEQSALRELSKKLHKEIEMATRMDTVLSEKIEEAVTQNTDPDRIKFVQEEVLFPLRQRIMDMQQMTVVNHQGIIAMEVIQRNNQELIRGVDRAKSVTVSALRTAVIVAAALNNQKIVLQKIKALNETTSNMIAGTSKLLKEQGIAIHKQSIEANISPDTLKTAFADVLASLEAVSTFKLQALPKLKQQINQFKEMADKGEIEIQKLEAGKALFAGGGE